MSDYYNPHRTRNLYDPLRHGSTSLTTSGSGQAGAGKPFKLSRSKIDLFISCPRCFYVDRRLGTGRPPGFPFALNSAVDALLKNEFDALRKDEKQHPLQVQYGIDARPVHHKNLDKWRENFVGVQFHHQPTNLIITGAIDDLWINSKDEYIVVDYKSTSKDKQTTELNEDWHDGYKRQMEVYQWLLRQNGYTVSDTGYFVYANGITGARHFNGKLEFELTLIPYQGSDNWVAQTLTEIKSCLDNNKIPDSSKECDYCAYHNALNELR